MEDWSEELFECHWEKPTVKCDACGGRRGGTALRVKGIEKRRVNACKNKLGNSW